MPKATGILSGYFNQGEGKRPLPQFLQELKAMTTDEKKKLAKEVAAVTGQTCEDCD